MSKSRNKEAILFWMPEWGGFHLGAWRSQEAPFDPTDLDVMRQMVQKAERAKFHGCFLADALAVGFQGVEVSTETLSHSARGTKFEPITLMSYLAGCTEHIGLLCTASSTYNEPFHVARKFASLDHLSHGRAGWNVVVSKAESENFGSEKLMDHAERYQRGQEFVDIVKGLWDSWEDDAFVRDKESGVFFHPEKLHALNYHGEHLSVAGPMHIGRPPQGHPVIAQAGASDTGRAFAARNADVIYTLQPDIERAKEFAAEIKEQAAAYGRDPEHIKVLPALQLLVGRSQTEADEKLAHLDSLVEPELGIEALATMIGTDLSGVPLDGPVPDVPESQGSKSRQKYWLDVAKRDNLTVRQLMQFSSRTGTVAVSATGIADMIQEWVEAGAADGFNVSFGDAVDSLDVFAEEVIPELQRRGIFQTDYRGATLRENLGLPRPANRFAASS